ncbi:MAG: hypothetical protein JW956_02035 [Calditrichaceae bacterium]|nr:hypothetical protein [Calditrichaceae bacterium]
MENKKPKPVKAQITYEVNDLNENSSDELSYYDYDDVYDSKSSKDAETFDMEFVLPDLKDEFIEALERWTDFVPDDVVKDDFEEGFNMMEYDEEFEPEEEDMAEFARIAQDHSSEINTSIPQRIVIYFDDGSEEDIQITNQEETLRRVLEIID